MKLNLVPNPILLIVQNFARASKYLQEQDWERFTTTAGKPGYCREFNDWEHAEENIANLFFDLDRPQMLFENITNVALPEWSRAGVLLHKICKRDNKRLHIHVLLPFISDYHSYGVINHKD